MPTKPPAFTEQGVTLDDAFDLTSALNKDAQAAVRQYRLGPLLTPPWIEGTTMRPGSIGCANWGGAAFDAESGYLMLKTTNQPTIAHLRRSDHTRNNPRANEVVADRRSSHAIATSRHTPGFSTAIAYVVSSMVQVIS